MSIYQLYQLQHRMGTTCCKDIDDHSLLIDIGDIANMYDYQPAEWPDHPYLVKLLQKSPLLQGELNQKPYKHKFFDSYYFGGWANGKPKGKGIYYLSDSNKKLYYEGEIDGEPNGHGKVVLNEGEWEYEGMINNGQAHGSGKMLNKKQGYSFDGQWRDSKPYKGLLIFHNNKKQKKANQGDTQINLTQNNHNSIIKYPDGRIYTGEIDKKRFVPHGIGKVVYPDQTQYIGQWQQGQMHGVGKFQWSDGSCYNGDYMFGKKHGVGKFVFNNGKYYNGNWKDGKQNGQGTLFSKQGQILKKGIWKNGVIESN